MTTPLALVEPLYTVVPLQRRFGESAMLSLWLDGPDGNTAYRARLTDQEAYALSRKLSKVVHDLSNRSEGRHWSIPIDLEAAGLIVSDILPKSDGPARVQLRIDARNGQPACEADLSQELARSLRRRKNNELKIPPDGPERCRIRRPFPPRSLLVAPVENNFPPRGPKIVLGRRLLAVSPVRLHATIRKRLTKARAADAYPHDGIGRPVTNHLRRRGRKPTRNEPPEMRNGGAARLGAPLPRRSTGHPRAGPLHSCHPSRPLFGPRLIAQPDSPCPLRRGIGSPLRSPRPPCNRQRGTSSGRNSAGRPQTRPDGQTAPQNRM